MRAVAEGDLVALHTHQIWPGGVEYVTMDFHEVRRSREDRRTLGRSPGDPIHIGERQHDVLTSRRKSLLFPPAREAVVRQRS